MVVFTIFFGRMANLPTDDIPYPLFAYAGLVPWTFFATAITSAGNSVVGSERLISKMYTPRLAIPFASVGAAVVDFFIALTFAAGPKRREGSRIVPKRARHFFVGWVQPTGRKPMSVGGLHPPYEEMGRCQRSQNLERYKGF
jgi:hypothetical protein